MRRSRSDGFALVTVVLVLAALLVLVAPFLLTARNADRASSQLFDRAETRIALDSAARHARVVLERSHGSLEVDPTPDWDSREELSADNRFPEEFLDPTDPRGTTWDLEVEDLTGRIDLASAGPGVIANLLGVTGRFLAAVGPTDVELEVSPMAGLRPSGFVLAGGELIHYGRIEDGVMSDLERGLLSQEDADGNPLPGFRPASQHAPGTPVLDQRAFALPLWRLTADGLRRPESPEQLVELDAFVMDEAGLGADEHALLEEFGTVSLSGRAGRVWQRPARLVRDIEGGVDDTLILDSPRWFNEGATVRIEDGESSELALVQRIGRGGRVILDRPLVNNYRAFESEVRVLARRPVNANTAPPQVLEALFTNLQIRGRGDRVTRTEARALAALVIASRPLTGLEDFLRRVCLPAGGIEPLPDDAPVRPASIDPEQGGGAIISPWDALAVYTNALNANDISLSFSTMPLVFAGLDVYRLELRAATHARSGVERFAAVREDVRLFAPQRELLSVFARQADFDEALRLDREAPWWMSGPEATTRFDPAGSVPPTRLWAQLGTYQGRQYLPGVQESGLSDEESPPRAEHVFASRDADGWAQLWPSRVEEVGPRAGRVLHFDHETRDPEGRYLPDQTIRRAADDPQVRWVGPGGLMRAIGFSTWVKPRSLEDALLLDVAGGSLESDRVTLGFEGGDLVLGVLAAGGDHPATAHRERTEARYALAAGEGPGLPVDVWSHIALDVQGSRPGQVQLLVNGMAHGVRTPGLTRLTAAVGPDSAFLPVESLEGFPERCVVRMGNELAEVVRDTGGFRAEFIASGTGAGFGGRNARVGFSGGEPSVPTNLATLDAAHPAGTAVELYGYSLPLASDLPAGGATLRSDLGAFRCAVAVGVEGGAQTNGDPISVTTNFSTFQAGWGLEGTSSAVTGLILAPAENPSSTAAEQVMAAFSPDGGYAALVQVRWSVGGVRTSSQGTPLGGIEVIRYSGWQGNVLEIAARGDAVTELADQEGWQSADQGVGAHAFVTDWGSTTTAAGEPVQSRLQWRLFVFPISVPVPGAGANQGFLAARAGSPQFAQLTHGTADSNPGDAENTEWVLYDWFEPTYRQLVRDDPIALERAYQVLTLRRSLEADDPGEGPGGGGGGGGGAPPGAPGGAGGASLSLTAAPPPPDPPAAPPQGGSFWEAELGVAEDQELPITRELREVFQHRGVMGTYSHSHPAGTRVLPVFRCRDSGPSGGRPGRFDTIFLFAADPTHIGWPLVVHRGHIPETVGIAHSWTQPDPASPLAADAAQSYAVPVEGASPGEILVALTQPAPEPMVAGPAQPTSNPVVDTRLLSRIVLWPSGERPRIVADVAIGGATRVGAAAIPSATVDEIVFADSEFNRNFPLVDPEATRGGALVLRAPAGESDSHLEVFARMLRLPLGDLPTTQDQLAQLPQDAGLLRIGDEILAYDELDASSGVLTLAVDGRGLLGTEPQPHRAGEAVHFLAYHAVTTLTSGVAAGDARLPVEDASDFPSAGTCLLGTARGGDAELVHHTWRIGSSLAMPLASIEPGRMDGRGAGLFRGRYGTTPASHPAGAAVIDFPFRYWDRWAHRAEGPELAYLGLSFAQPGAFWKGLFFTAEEAAGGRARLGVLERTDPTVPWDADPDTTDGLRLFWRGTEDGGPVPIGVACDQPEWRVFVEYQPGAFDAATGMAHDWRTTPRLSRFGAFYLAPSLCYRSIER